MSGLESEPFIEFKIRKENEEKSSSQFNLTKDSDSSAGAQVPQELRQEALRKFDLETEEASSRIEEPPSTSDQIQKYLKNAALLLKNQDFELAQNILQAVLKSEPKNQIAMQGMAESFLELDKINEALEVYIELAKIAPTFENISSVADIYYRMGKDSSAAHWYYKALDSQEFESPGLFSVYKNLGNIAVRGGDLDSAEENYNKAYTLNPDSDVLLVNYGTLEIQRGHFEQALARFRNAAEINSNNEKAWVGLALIHRECGDHDLSWANIEKALDIDPVNETAMRLIVDWSYRDNRLADGIRQLEEYLKLAPEDHEMRMILAQFLVSLCRYKHASNHIHQLEQFGVVSPEVNELKQIIEGVTS